MLGDAGDIRRLDGHGGITRRGRLASVSGAAVPRHQTRGPRHGRSGEGGNGQERAGDSLRDRHDTIVVRAAERVNAACDAREAHGPTKPTASDNGLNTTQEDA